jgi:hypothetical protein
VIRSKGQNFTIGPTKDFDGKRAHTPSQLANLNKYSDRLRDYCHQGDPMCAVGSEPVNVYNHLDYFLEHNEEVVLWVVEKAKAESGGQVSQEQHSTPSPTPIPERSSSALTPSSPILASSSFPTHTNNSSQSSSATSAIAKSAVASPTPSSVASATRTATDFSETHSAQAGNTGTSNGNVGTGNETTGAGSALVVSPLLVAVAAVAILAM